MLSTISLNLAKLNGGKKLGNIWLNGFFFNGRCVCKSID